jgi:hypothetical protein
MAEVISHWKITSSWGQTVSAQTPVVKLSVGASTLHFKLANDKTKERILLDCKGVGVGIGVSVSALVVAGVDGSIEKMPSGGIGSVLDLRLPLSSKPLAADDFAGFAIVNTGTIKGMAGGSISTVIFTRLPPIGGLIIPKAAGFFAGMVAGTTLGLGAESYLYYVHSVTDLNAPPEVHEIPQVKPDERPATAVPVGDGVYLVPSPERDVFGG